MRTNMYSIRILIKRTEARGRSNSNVQGPFFPCPSPSSALQTFSIHQGVNQHIFFTPPLSLKDSFRDFLTLDHPLVQNR